MKENSEKLFTKLHLINLCKKITSFLPRKCWHRFGSFIFSLETFRLWNWLTGCRLPQNIGSENRRRRIQCGNRRRRIQCGNHRRRIQCGNRRRHIQCGNRRRRIQGGNRWRYIHWGGWWRHWFWRESSRETVWGQIYKKNRQKNFLFGLMLGLSYF